MLIATWRKVLKRAWLMPKPPLAKKRLGGVFNSLINIEITSPKYRFPLQ